MSELESKMGGLKFIRVSDKKSHPKYGLYRIWECPYCGKHFEALNYQAKNKSKRGGLGHCGCQTKIRQREKNKGRVPVNKLDDLTASANKVWQYSRKHGRSLSKEDVKLLVSSPCYYCGSEPSVFRELGSGRWTRKSSVPTNGIDRKDSTLGYHLYNCVPCCPTCNYLKSDMHHDDFIKLCKAIAKNTSNEDGNWVGK